MYAHFGGKRCCVFIFCSLQCEYLPAPLSFYKLKTEEDYYVALFILLMGVKTRERIIHYYVQYSTVHAKTKCPRPAPKLLEQNLTASKIHIIQVCQEQNGEA